MLNYDVDLTPTVLMADEYKINIKTSQEYFHIWGTAL